MANIKPILNLNKHPNNCENLSLIDAHNIMLSPDNSNITSEKSLLLHKLNNIIINDLGFNFKIVGCIPCSTELILFVINKADFDNSELNTINCTICRYNESNDKLIYFKDITTWHRGILTGTFTYNGRQQLIIAYGESDGKEDVPLKTINLGTFEENLNNNNDNNEVNSPDNMFALCPEVYIPSIDNVRSINSNITKGFYEIYIRFKINKTDYTKWYYLNYNNYIGTLNKVNILKTFQYINNAKYSQGCTDNINIKEFNSTKSIEFDLENLNYNKTLGFKFYQLGYIVYGNDFRNGYRTSDIDINVSTYSINTTNFNIPLTTAELTDFYNYYNVKNIINYQNRIYISNYKEKEDIPNIDEIVGNIKLKASVRYKNSDAIKLVITDSNGKSQFESNNLNNVTGVEAFNVPKGTKLKVQGEYVSNEFYLNSLLVNKVDYYPGINYKDIFDCTDFKNSLDSNGTYSAKGDCTVSYGGQIYQGTEEVYINWPVITQEPQTSWYIFTCQDQFGTKMTLEVNSFLNSGTVNCNIKITYNKGEEILNAEDLKISIQGNDYKVKNPDTGVEDENLVVTFANSDDELLKPYSTDALRNNYINSSDDFENRQIETTLIPGEIYNFYIHFVDKYGEATKGYRIDNNVVNEALKYKYIFIDDNIDDTSIIAKALGNEYIFDESGNINFNNVSFVYFNKVQQGTTDSYATVTTELKSKLTSKLLYLPKNIKWQDLPSFISSYGTYKISSATDEKDNYDDLVSVINVNVNKRLGFEKYINSNGDNLFKVSDFPIFYYLSSGKTDTSTNDTINNSFYSADSYKIAYPIINIAISDVDIPNEYKGYFLSYEKLEKTCIAKGILTKNDCITTRNDTDKNSNDNNKMQFYCSDYDILSSVDINYTFGYSQYQIYFAGQTDKNKYINNELYNFIFNQPIICNRKSDIFFNVGIPDIAAGGDTTKNKLGLGTSLILDNDSRLFPYGDYTISRFYLVNFYKCNENIYTNTDKTLIPFTKILYNDGDRVIKENYNGHLSFDSVICYNGDSVLFNSATTKFVDYKLEEYIKSSRRYAGYFQWATINDYFKENKSFNNKPDATGFYLSDASTSEDDLRSIIMGFYVSPENSIDLFSNNFTDINITKSLINYNKNLYYIYEYNNYVRRSNVIQDESLENAWRKFPLEGYKIISENKGKIVNIVGIGTVFLVHCEHSLFMFDRDNTLQTGDKAVQLQMPDIFDVDYKELTTSKLGYAGLQDKKSAIVDQFGYIFYDRDKNRFYKFDANTLDFIDYDIVNFLNKYKPINVIFANDFINNRLLIRFITNDSNKYVLSFNYIINKFVSIHDYDFIDAYNTKNELYLFNENNESTYTNIIQFSKEEKYREFEINNNKITFNNTLSFIINDNYNIIKFINYIIYKLYQIDNTKERETNDTEQRLIPYSGEIIRVYNDLTDTKDLDIKIDSEDAKNVFCNYKKPYWELGNWNFSYLRNDKDETSAPLKSLIYGNYFIIKFVVGDINNNNKIEFESLNYNLSKR